MSLLIPDSAVLIDAKLLLLPQNDLFTLLFYDHVKKFPKYFIFFRLKKGPPENNP